MPKLTLKGIISAVIIGLGVVALLLALGIKVASQIKPSDNPLEINVNQAVEENFKITYTINKGDGQETSKFDYVLHKGEKQTVFDILKDLSQENNFDLKYNNNYSFGVFIESIAGVKNGTDKKYWQYYVNDKLGEAAADKKEIKSGDKVEWKFEKVPEF